MKGAWQAVTQLGRLSLLSAALLVVEAPGAALFLCMVLIVHIDNTTGFQAQWCASHTYSLYNLTTYNNNQIDA